MGVVLNWNSTYPLTVDDATTNFPTVNDNVHDVLASHVNELASAVISLENVVGGFRSAPVEDPFTTLSDGDILTYNATAGEWQASPSTATDSLQTSYDGGNTISLTAATPVAITTSAVGQDGITITDGVDTITFRGDQILAADGAAGDPSFSFISEPDTGIYFGGDAEFAIASNGNQVAGFKYNLDESTGDEVLFNLFGEVNKATSGNYTGIRLNVTETAAPGTDDRLLDLQVGGTSQIYIDNAGRVFAADGATSVPSIAFVGATTTGFSGASNLINFIVGGVREAYMLPTTFSPASDGGLSLGVSTAGWNIIYGRQSGGAVGSPTYTWAADTDTGFYKPGTDIAAVTAGGTEVVRFDGSGATPQVLAADGAVGTPAYSFANDSDTGFYYTTDRIRIAFAGVDEFIYAAVGFWPNGTAVLGLSASNYWSQIWGASAEGSTTSGPNVAAYDLTAVGTNAGAYAIGVNTALLTQTTPNTTDLMTTLDELDAAITAALGGLSTSLQDAYDNGETISLTAATPIVITSTGAGQEIFSLTDGTNTVTIRGDKVFIPFGSAASPSLTFAGDDNTGVYRSGSDQVGISCGTTQSANFAAGSVRVVGGTELGPGLAFIIDGDTGFYHVSADIFAATSGGSEVVRFDGSGATPQVLAVDGTVTLPGLAFLSDADTGFYWPAADTLALSTGGQESLRSQGDLAASSGEEYGLLVTTTGNQSGTAGFAVLKIDYTETSVGSGRRDLMHITRSAADRFRMTDFGALRARESNSPSTPVYSFLTDSNTGMYHVGGDQLGLSAGGSVALTLSGTGANTQALFEDGSLSLPSISFASDPDTGFMWNASGQMWMVLNGSIAMLYDTGSVTCEVSRFRVQNGTEAAPSLVFENDANTGFYRPVDGWDGTGMGVSIQGDEVARFENDAAWDDGNLQITKDLVESAAVEQVWQNDGGAWTDITTAAANATNNDTNLFPATSATGDYFAVGMDRPFAAVIFDQANGTAGTNQPTLVWEYWNGSSWAALTIITDETVGFSTTADGLTLSFQRPTDWATTSLNSVTKYYIRARISFSQYTTSPVVDQIKIPADQIALAINVPDASVVTTGTYSRVDGVRINSEGTPTGDISFRYFAVDYEGETQFSIQTMDGGGGTGVFVPESGSGPGYCFLDSVGGIDDGLGMSGDLGQQEIHFWVNDSTEALRVTENALLAKDGTEALPGISFINETDVGLYRPAANQLTANPSLLTMMQQPRASDLTLTTFGP